jgi:hypothetical protein
MDINDINKHDQKNINLIFTYKIIIICTFIMIWLEIV